MSLPMQLIKSIVLSLAFAFAGVASATSLISHQCNINDVCGFFDASGVVIVTDPCCPPTECINGDPSSPDPVVFCL
ncbi:hypothetical protein DFH07DRAFT_950814 [Mycena maculata]|uniref:Uncharacterized protein n=1 Tax=Mycena maculata TaxID=230809 RepID=A0AAD7NWJ2_9AGAR|nr:hypothetical protein DFH07DRAFT_950814 [Mycena maculata]